MAIGAVAGSAGMRHLGGVDELGLVVMAGYADCFGVRLRQHDFSVFRRSVAGIAAPGLEGRMHELHHQLGRRGLMGIVALHAVGGGERLTLMRFLQVSILGIVAIEAERRRRFGQMELVVHGRFGAGFVGNVAGVTAHVERGMAAALLWRVHSGLVATEAEVLFFGAGHGLEELILVVADVGIVASEAVAHRGGMHGALDARSPLIVMAGEAKRKGRGGDQLDARNVFVYADLMAA